MNSMLSYAVKRIIHRTSGYKRILKAINETENADRDALERYQLERLIPLIRHCCRNVPYYSELFCRNGIVPEDIRQLSDIKKLPMLTREDILNNYDKLHAVTFSRRLCQTAETSGTTGQNIRITRDYRSILHEEAFINRYLSEFGLSGKNLRIAHFRGEVLPQERLKSHQFSVKAPFGNRLIFSSFELGPENFPYYLDQLQSFKPHMLYGYPSVLLVLAKLLHDHGVSLQLSAVMTSSENLSPENRLFMESIFQCRVLDWYGQAERVAAISLCPRGHYHLVEDYSIIELVDSPNGHEIVGTSLFNYAMPLIRYRTSDYVRIDTEKTQPCTCGSHFRCVDGLFGRKPGYILTPENQRIPVFLLDDLINLNDGVLEFQIAQQHRDELILNLVTLPSYTGDNEQEIRHRLIERISGSMSYVFRYCQHLKRSPGGKMIHFLLEDAAERQA